MTMDPDEILYLIQSGIPEAQVTLSDIRGDGRQYAARILSPTFAGRTRLEQHRMVYETLKGKTEEELQMLSILTAAA